MKSGEKGFTLIELLVVVAIIAIMAALLIPVLNTAKMRAQTATCMNNLKQLKIVIALYDQDHGIHLASTGDSNWTSSLTIWANMTGTKLPDTFCPVLKKRYYTNYNLDRTVYTPEEVTNSNCVLLLDGKNVLSDYRYAMRWTGTAWQAVSGTAEPAEWHNGVGVVLFWDGHCEVRKKKQLEDVQWWNVKVR
ncbi:MAG TPA: type II secretion system protein [bacterium]|nr:type II secretion system protein [bacterium]HPP11974.1 type II secretion system protein [bacterium]